MDPQHPPVYLTVPDHGSCWSLTCDDDGNVYICKSHSIYICEDGRTIRRYTGSSQGNKLGVLSVAQFNEPHGLCWRPSGILYLSDRENHLIKYIQNGEVFWLAGRGSNGKQDGEVKVAEFNRPYGVTELNGKIFVSDWGDTIRMIDNEVVSTIGNGELARKNGSLTSASFHFPTGLCPGPDNTLYVAESTGCSIRQIDFKADTVTTVLGGKKELLVDGPDSEANLGLARGIVWLPTGEVYFCDRGSDMIRRWHDGMVTSVLDLESAESSKSVLIPGPVHFPYTTKAPSALCFTPDGAMWWAETSGYLCSIPDVIPGACPKSNQSFLPLMNLLERFPTDLVFKVGPNGTSEARFHSFILQLTPDYSPQAFQAGLLASKAHYAIKYLSSLLYGKDECETIEDLFETFELALDCKLRTTALYLLRQLSRRNIPNNTEKLSHLPPDHLGHLWMGHLHQHKISATYDESVSEIQTIRKYLSGPYISPMKLLLNSVAEKRLINEKSDIWGFQVKAQSKSGYTTITAPSWLLYCRWSYFERMMNTGLCEVENKILELPSDFPASLLVPLITFICTDTVEKRLALEKECPTFLIENGQEYNLLDQEGKPLTEFKRFYDSL